VELARGAGEVITGLTEAIGDSARVAEQIAADSRQQTEGVGLVVTAVSELTHSMSRAVEGTREIERAAGELTNLSRRLGELVAMDEHESQPA
jgi:methyl-accepting chemotaxis protein